MIKTLRIMIEEALDGTDTINLYHCNDEESKPYKIEQIESLVDRGPYIKEATIDGQVRNFEVVMFATGNDFWVVEV